MSARSREDDAVVGRTILHIPELVAGYGGQAVLHRVQMRLVGGEIVSLLGANGAGKSTLLKTIMGTVPVIKGSIFLLGYGISKWAPHHRVEAGIGFSPEGRRVFPNLTVEENLLIGATPLSRRNRRENLSIASEVFPVLGQRMKQRAGTLSGGEQQMLAISRAMMTKPKLLLVEEPSQGLAPVVVDRIYEALRELVRETGIAVLVAEQFQQVNEEASDRILVIDKGEVISDSDLARMGTAEVS
ncbi:MAG TPA: ABC transporter ATP-binding protein [Sporichthyaceae bacterium]|jgi:ABC-type branched-subunit amino acid transport system ATPase component|nr:ABC transporter ATP-binding protein [Sporichthyaceae bacterium]